MNGKPKLHPFTILMFVFVLIGLFMALANITEAVMNQDLFDEVFAAIILLFMGGVAFWTLSASSGSPGTTGRDALRNSIRFYVEAWNQLRRQTWLRWLLGSIVVFQFICRFAEVLQPNSALTKHYNLESDSLNLTDSLNSGSAAIIFNLPSHIIAFITRSVTYFTATLDLHRNILFAPILISIVILFVYLRIQRDRPDDSVKGGLTSFKRISLAFAIFCLLYGIAAIIFHLNMLSQMHGDTDGYRLILSLPPVVFVWMIASAVFSIMMNSMLFAGYYGSLIRVRDQKTVNPPSFADDVMTYIRPALKLYLTFYLFAFVMHQIVRFISLSFRFSMSPLMIIYLSHISAILQTLFALGLLFFPYVILQKNGSVKESVSASFRIWRDGSGTVSAFVSVGVIFIVPLLLLYWLIAQTMPGMKEHTLMYEAVTGLCRAGMYAIIAVIMSLAIFNLYNHLTKDDVKDVEPVADMS